MGFNLPMVNECFAHCRLFLLTSYLFHVLLLWFVFVLAPYVLLLRLIFLLILQCLVHEFSRHVFLKFFVVFLLLSSSLLFHILLLLLILLMLLIFLVLLVMLLQLL